MNISQFKATLSSRGFARKNRFEVFFTLPPAVSGVDLEMTLRAERASFPGRSIMTIDDHRGTIGPQRKIGYAPMYDTFSTTLICNRFMDEKEKLERWLDYIVGDYRGRNIVSSGNFGAGYYNDYTGTIEVQQYSETDAPMYRTKLIEAYPISLNALDLDWGSSDIHKVDATFAYRYYT